MVSIKFLACIFVLFTATFASKVVRTLDVLPTESSGFLPVPTPKANRGKKIIAVTDELLPIVRQEDGEFAFDSSESGFGRIARVGVSVTRGASATAKFDITVTAVDAETLDRNDEAFVETLTAEERVEYDALKENFSGGLNIPMLDFIGADLSESVTTEDFVETRENFESKNQAISELLESAVDTRIRINGTLTATGIRSRPTVAFAFVRLARVDFQDGSSQLVVSTDPTDILAADRNGNVAEASEQDADFTCAAGFFCD